jgi:hypothetical protein
MIINIKKERNCIDIFNDKQNKDDFVKKSLIFVECYK